MLLKQDILSDTAKQFLIDDSQDFIEALDFPNNFLGTLQLCRIAESPMDVAYSFLEHLPKDRNVHSAFRMIQIVRVVRDALLKTVESSCTAEDATYASTMLDEDEETQRFLEESRDLYDDALPEEAVDEFFRTPETDEEPSEFDQYLASASRSDNFDYEDKNPRLNQEKMYERSVNYLTRGIVHLCRGNIEYAIHQKHTTWNEINVLAREIDILVNALLRSSAL